MPAAEAHVSSICIVRIAEQASLSISDCKHRLFDWCPSRTLKTTMIVMVMTLVFEELARS